MKLFEPSLLQIIDQELKTLRVPALLTGLLLAVSTPANAGGLLDYIRDYDLNDYALGLSISNSQSPYLGSSDSTLAYPYLTSFRHSAFTDDWLLLQGDNIGFRYITKSDWEIGFLGRAQLRGLALDDDIFPDLEQREWAVEAGPLIGWRGSPVHVQFRSYWELPNRHNGTTSELEFRLPREFPRGYFVPNLTITHLSDDYSNYFFGVSPEEASTLLPEFRPGSAINTEIGVTLGYQLSPNWLLQTKLKYEHLDSAITDSPLVDRDGLWSGSISLAYNSNLFRPRDYDGADKAQNFRIRVGAFNSSIDTKLLSGDDLERSLGAPSSETITQIDALFRIAFYHRFELGYFELQRHSLTTLQRDALFREQLYPEDTTIEFRSNSQFLRAGYSYSLMRDGQKELGLTAGLSWTRFEAEVREEGQQPSEQATVEVVLPTFGIFGSLPLGAKWHLGADIDVFILGLERYEGYMAYVALDLERKFNDNFGVGIGYNFYGMRLKSKKEALDGTLRVRYQGPKIYLSMAF